MHVAEGWILGGAMQILADRNMRKGTMLLCLCHAWKGREST